MMLTNDPSKKYFKCSAEENCLATSAAEDSEQHCISRWVACMMFSCSSVAGVRPPIMSSSMEDKDICKAGIKDKITTGPLELFYYATIYELQTYYA